MVSTPTTSHSPTRSPTWRRPRPVTPEPRGTMKRILPLLVLAACGRGDDRSPPAPLAAAARPVLEHDTQADLARELGDAERLGTWREAQHRWQGQHVQWTVTRQRLLC